MLRLTIIAILVIVSTLARAAPPLSFVPFQGVDLSALSPSQRKTIIQASEDFERVLKGKTPKHAVLDEEAPHPADGGTQFFIGKGYKLTIIQSLSSFGALNGYIYGPVISFSKPFAPGNMSDVVGLRFYTSEQLHRLQSSK